MRMTPRSGGCALVAALMACGTVLPAHAAPQGSADGARVEVPQLLAAKPNIVLITADDMRPGDLKAMPFTRRVLAQRGVRFTDAISPYPLCCPARAEILTGQYSHNSGVRGNSWPNGGYWALRGRKNTLPVWLRAAGYRTAFVGKYLNGYESGSVPTCDGQRWCDHLAGRHPHEIPPGWSRWYASVGRTYRYWGVRMRVSIPEREPHYEWSPRYQSYLYADIVTERIIPAFRRADRSDDRPFFIWFSSATPHTVGNDVDGLPPVPFSPDRTRPHSGLHWKRFADERLPGDDHFAVRFNEDTSDKAGPMTRLGVRDRNEMRDLHRHRLASLISLDEAIEQVVDKLKATGEWDNTVLVFTSDNAFGLGQHRVKAKNMPYDAFLRVPMIVSGRGIKARFDPAAAHRTIVDSPLTVTTIDIAATAVRLAEATPGRTLDGIDMLRPRLNPDFGPRGHRAVLIESGWIDDERSDVSRFVGIRTDRWRWFGWDALPIGGTLTFNVLGRFTRSIEFYDRRVDPAQLNNIHGAAHADVEERMRRMVQQRFDCQGRECVGSAPG